jgi:hypothetical protein
MQLLGTLSLGSAVTLKHLFFEHNAIGTERTPCIGVRDQVIRITKANLAAW